MRKHTKEFKKSIPTFGRQLDNKITIVGNNLVLEKDDLYSITPVVNADLLKSVMKEVDFESKQQISVGQEINVKSGVMVNGEHEYIDFGNYFVYKSEYKAETMTYSHVCYDKMLNTMIDYVPLDITYPISLREYIGAIATKCGLEFANKNGTFANYDTPINEDHFSNGNYTFRDILDYVAQIVGGWLCINDGGELEVRYPEMARNYGNASGESISFTTDVSDKISKIVVDGRSTQETRSGKNLFDINYTYKVGDTFTYKGVSITYDDNGYIVLNGTAETRDDLNIVAQAYTITLDKDIYLHFELFSGSASNSSRGVSVQAINKSGTSIWSYDANANVPIMKVPYSDIASIKWIRIPLVVGESFNNYKFRFWVSTENSLNYEPYGVMPSPDYPSEVECVKGKNLFDKSKIFSGWIRYSNNAIMADSSNTFYYTDFVEVSPSTTYTLNLAKQTGLNFGGIMEYDITKNWLNIGLAETKQIITFTTSANTKYIRFTIRFDSKDKVMLEKGLVATDYVPVNTIQIRNVGNNYLPDVVDKTTKTLNGITLSFLNNNQILLSGTSTARTVFDLALKESIRITKDIYVHLRNNTQNYQVAIGFFKSGTQFGWTSFGPTDKISNLSGITMDELEINTLRFQINAGQTINITIQPSLEYTSNITKYEPYKSQILNIDLQDNGLCSIGDIKDELIAKNGKAKILKKIGKVTLNGSENWAISLGAPNQNNTIYLNSNNFDGLAKAEHMISNYFASTIDLWSRDMDGIYYDTQHGNSFRLRINKTIASTVNEFKTWLSTHNPTVYYILEEPYEIDLGEVETLNTFGGVNNVSLGASMNTNMNITYTTNFEEFDKHFLKDVNVSFTKKYGAINSVVFSRGGGPDNIYRKDNASVSKNGLTEIKISDNPFLEGDDRENFIQAIFDKLNGLEFYLLDVASTGIMYMELGDLYYFNMIEEKPPLKSGLVKSGMRKAQGSSGGKYICLLMNDEIKITQGLEESIYTDEPVRTETDYKTSAPTDNSIKNAIIQTNKNSAEISLKVNDNEIISAINLSPEKIKISSAKLDIDAIATFTNSKLAEAGSTVINGANITTGSISCDRLNGGTINGQAIRGGSISITTGNYYFNMGTSTSNPNCSGLNVGNYGVKAYSNITATGFAITDSDTGKSGTFILRHSNGTNVVYLTFTGGILTAFDIV